MDENLKMLYLSNPCGTLATAFWKERHFTKPEGIRIVLEKDACSDFGEGTRYFRLSHDLRGLQKAILPDGYTFREVVIPDEAEIVAHIINQCYEGYSQTKESVLTWSKYPVFDNNLWIFILDGVSEQPVALGIADFDAGIKEGSLEWIQVLPKYQGMGFGKAVVLELLARLKDKADFVTVSGEVDNATNPEQLYRKSGFVGDDVWVVLKS